MSWPDVTNNKHRNGKKRRVFFDTENQRVERILTG